MALLGNKIFWFAVLGGSSCAMIGFSVLLVRLSLRDQTRSLLRERLDSIRRINRPYVELPKIPLKKEEFFLVQSRKGSKFAEYLRGRLGIGLNPKLIIALIAFLSFLIVSSFAAYLFYHAYLGLITGVVIFGTSMGVWWFFKFRRARFLMACDAQLPELLDFIVRALRAGHAFSTSLSLASEELREPLGPECRRIYREQELGIPLESALVNLTERVPLLDLKYFATAYLIHRELGGNLAEVLQNISRIIRERFKLKKHVHAITAEGRMSAWVLSILPFATAVSFFAIRPEYINTLLTDPLGQKLTFVALCLWFIGIIVIRRIVRIEY
ncbi:MAG TPA: type II secretion system F family protein [Candidatus Hypogeohydataceae bacterium YC41]